MTEEIVLRRRSPLARLRYLSDHAAGTAFLPPACQVLAESIPALLDIAEAAQRWSDLWHSDALDDDLDIRIAGSAAVTKMMLANLDALPVAW